MENENSYDDLLGELKEHYSQNKTKIFIPTTNNYADFTPISVKQHKDILKTNDNMMLSSLQFNINTNEAILNNISANTNDLMLIDRPSIILSLKQSMTDGNAKISIDDQLHEIDLQSHIDTFPSIKFTKSLLKKTISLGSLKVKCSIPTIYYDVSINKNIISKLKNKKEDSIMESIGEVYVYELIKFIDEVNTGSSSVDLKQLTFDQKSQVCDMLPLELSNKIISYINKVKSIDHKYTKCTDVKGNNIEIPLSVTLFAGD